MARSREADPARGVTTRFERLVTSVTFHFGIGRTPTTVGAVSSATSRVHRFVIHGHTTSSPYPWTIRCHRVEKLLASIQPSLSLSRLSLGSSLSNIYYTVSRNDTDSGINTVLSFAISRRDIFIASSRHRYNSRAKLFSTLAVLGLLSCHAQFLTHRCVTFSRFVRVSRFFAFRRVALRIEGEGMKSSLPIV